MAGETWLDYYEVMQVSPNADSETIERVFRLLARRYHPDNSESGDEDKFKTLMAAYRVLSDPEKRAAYDAGNEGMRSEKWRNFYQPSISNGFDTDEKLRQGILSLLYTVRRRSPLKPGLGGIHMENLLGCPQALMEFHLWYLKGKGWIHRTDSGEYAITVPGVDALLSNVTLSEEDRLLPSSAESPVKG